jgi:hypothetical protein
MPSQRAVIQVVALWVAMVVRKAVSSALGYFVLLTAHL